MGSIKRAALLVLVVISAVVVDRVLIRPVGEPQPAQAQDSQIAGLCQITRTRLTEDEITLNDCARFIAFGELELSAREIIGGEVWWGYEVMGLPTAERIALANTWFIEAGGSKSDCPQVDGDQVAVSDSPTSGTPTIDELEDRISELERQVALLTSSDAASDLPPVNPNPDLLAYGVGEPYAFDMRCGIALPSNPYRKVNTGFYLFHCERIPPFGFANGDQWILVFDDVLP